MKTKAEKTLEMLEDGSMWESSVLTIAQDTTKVNTAFLFKLLAVHPYRNIDIQKIKETITLGVDLWSRDLYDRRPVEIASNVKRYDIVTVLLDAEDNYRKLN